MAKNDRIDNVYAMSGFFLAVIVIALISLGLYHLIEGSVIKPASSLNQAASGSSATSNASNASTNPYAVLPPATVPSRVAECSQDITFASDGTSGPQQCSNGDLNTKEWSALSANEPSVMSLGYSPSLSQVESAMCSDVKNTRSDANTNNASQIEAITYQIAALYYGWSFSSSPASVLSSGSC